jgi:hypothetical protein
MLSFLICNQQDTIKKFAHNFIQYHLKELYTQQQRSLFITQSTRQLYSELAKNDGNLVWTRVSKGASRAKKSTTLLFQVHWPYGYLKWLYCFQIALSDCKGM